MTSKSDSEKCRDIYIGYDPREVEAYSVCQQSLIRRSSIPLDVHALRLDVLQNLGVMKRPQTILGQSAVPNIKTHAFRGSVCAVCGVRIEAVEDGIAGPCHGWEGNEKTNFDKIDGYPFSTEFAFTRFLVPYIQKAGWALFCDCDFLFMDDVKELFDLVDDKYAVMVVKHDYQPKTGVKMDDQPQESYYRKNWSSLILWNCSHPANKRLTLDKVNTEMGRYLHSFMWLRDEEIGALPEAWNYLVGHSEGPDAKALHYTEGGPWFEEFKDCGWADTWREERDLQDIT